MYVRKIAMYETWAEADNWNDKKRQTSSRTVTRGIHRASERDSMDFFFKQSYVEKYKNCLKGQLNDKIYSG